MQTIRTPSAASWCARRARAPRRCSTRRPASSRRPCRCRPRPSSTPPSPPPRRRFPAWANTPPLKRAPRHVHASRSCSTSNADDIAARDLAPSTARSMPTRWAKLQRGIEVVDFACGIPHLLKGEFSRNVGPGIDSYSDRQPLGVVAGITPFNFPAMVPMWMYPVAIACGNTFILKPSERDPSALDAGLRAVHGGRLARRRAQRRPRRQGSGRRDPRPIPTSRRCRFVGSTPIAEYVYRTRHRRTGSACRRWAAPRTT